MGKFKKQERGQPAINTSSLPDIVFMLLFFFMVATKMRDSEVLVKQVVPTASEVEKIEKKSWVNYILVGPPLKPKRDGSAPRIQLDDHYGDVDEVDEYIILKINDHPESHRPYLTTAIKGHNTVRMGLIQDIKQELRKANALKVLYSAKAGDVREDQ